MGERNVNADTLAERLKELNFTNDNPNVNEPPEVKEIINNYRKQYSQIIKEWHINNRDQLFAQIKGLKTEFFEKIKNLNSNEKTKKLIFEHIDEVERKFIKEIVEVEENSLRSIPCPSFSR